MKFALIYCSANFRTVDLKPSCRLPLAAGCERTVVHLDPAPLTGPHTAPFPQIGHVAKVCPNRAGVVYPPQGAMGTPGSPVDQGYSK